jgi:transposase-like protein
VLVHLAFGNREGYESWKASVQDLGERRMKEPLLVVMDGNPGLKRGVRECWPRPPRQGCRVHKSRNLLAKVFGADSYARGMKLGPEPLARKTGDHLRPSASFFA